MIECIVKQISTCKICRPGTTDRLFIVTFLNLICCLHICWFLHPHTVVSYVEIDTRTWNCKLAYEFGVLHFQCYDFVKTNCKRRIIADIFQIRIELS